MQPHRYGNRSRSGAGGAGARLDWLCGRWALHSQRLLVLQQKMLDIGIFCLVYLGIQIRRHTRTQSPKSQKRISGAQPETVAFTLPTKQCAPRRVIQHFCISLKSRRPIRSFASGNSPNQILVRIRSRHLAVQRFIWGFAFQSMCESNISSHSNYVDCRHSCLRFFVLPVMAD